METVLALLVALLAGLGLHLMLTRSFVKVVLGLSLMANAVNLVVFVAAGLTRGVPVFVDQAGEVPEAHSDPVSQALVLTAIVINFALQAFALVLVYRVFQTTGTDDPDAFPESEATGAQGPSREDTP